MAKSKISVTECPPRLRALINVINGPTFGLETKNIIVGYEGPEDPELVRDMGFFRDLQVELRRVVHQFAQFAALSENMRENYIQAVKGSAADWKRFCRGLPAPLWRDWAEADIPAGWRKPYIPVGLAIDDDYKARLDNEDLVTAFKEMPDARRLRECRKCQRIFWASRIEKDGGPYGCSPNCNNALRQREFKERKRLDERDAKRRKKP